MHHEPLVAYFSMEIGLTPEIPTYSGGLGVLAGDTLRSAADLGLPMVGVTLLHRAGYFRQHLDPDGGQIEEPVKWEPERHLEPVDAKVQVEIEGRSVAVRAWRHRVRGEGGAQVPVYLLDTDVPTNEQTDRRLTDHLYGGDERYRLAQEAVLGIGGVRMLRRLGCDRLRRFHLNEGHAALLILALLEERLHGKDSSVEEIRDALDDVRRSCVFTTHTPVPAGHDQFPSDLAERVLGSEAHRRVSACLGNDQLNMTELALEGTHYVNGVAMTHGHISRDMYPRYPIHSITNGVHARTWTAPPFQVLFDRFLPDWRRNSFSLRHAVSIPLQEIWSAHREAKRALLARVRESLGVRLDEDVLTLGFARRATAYKRGDLVFRDGERLKALARRHGGLQLVFGGKAHPRDTDGKGIIRSIHRAGESLAPDVSVVYLPDYGMELGALLTSGVDVWLNNPVPPLEASGTSGMKAALNGVPSLSVLDGWWVEGYARDVTGWSFGADPFDPERPRDDDGDAASLYERLGEDVMPCYAHDRERFIGIMRNAIALNGSFFNTERMVWQYLHNAYGIASVLPPRHDGAPAD